MAAIAEVRRFLRPVKRAWNKAHKRIFGYPDDYLSDCRGVIHVGANIGQERDDYAERGLAVLWIEPIPEVHLKLAENIRDYPNQVAIEALIADSEVEHILHVADNEGASSSIFEFGKHKDIWPDINYTHDLKIKSRTLPTVLRDAGIDPTDYDALVLDTQGSELLVLRGAEGMLSKIKYIKAEAAEFESYRGGASASYLISFLRIHNFVVARSDTFAKHPQGGRYADFLFRNKALSEAASRHQVRNPDL